MLHLLNPTGYPARITVDVGDSTALLDRPLVLPARTGRMLGLGLELPGGDTLVSSNAEIIEATPDGLRFSPGLREQTEVWLRTDREVSGPTVRRDGELTVVTGPAGAELVLEFGQSSGLRRLRGRLSWDKDLEKMRRDEG